MMVEGCQIDGGVVFVTDEGNSWLKRVIVAAAGDVFIEPSPRRWGTGDRRERRW